MHHTFSNLRILIWPLELNTSKIKNIILTLTPENLHPFMEPPLASTKKLTRKSCLVRAIGSAASSAICPLLWPPTPRPWPPPTPWPTWPPPPPPGPPLPAGSRPFPVLWLPPSWSDSLVKVRKSQKEIVVSSNTQKKLRIFFLVSALRVYNGSNQRNKGTLYTNYGLFLHNKLPLFFWFDPF